MSKKLIEDIYYKLSPAFINDIVPENDDILKRIKENINLYGNVPIDDIDKEHSWVKVLNPRVSDMRFIKTNGYQKHLEECIAIDKRNADILSGFQNKRQAINAPMGLAMFFHPYRLEEHPIPWNNYLKLQAYRCINTNAVGFTYYIKNTFMIKPFHIIKHSWKLDEVTSSGIRYTCSSCATIAYKRRGGIKNEIFPESDFMLSCNEHMIKKLLE